MQIQIVEKMNSHPDRFPALTLAPDAWDDFGFRTTFHVRYWRGPGDHADLQRVKIMQLGMNSGRPELPALFSTLPDDFGSLGADIDYYERVALLDQPLGSEILGALKDLAIDPERLAIFEREHAFVASLVRLPPAKDALRRIGRLRDENEAAKTGEAPEPAPPKTGAAIAEANVLLDGLKLDAQGSVGSEQLRIEFDPPQRAGREFRPRPLVFDFTSDRRLPGKLIAMVGPNGTGKTTVLSELALALFFGADEATRASHGIARVTSGSVRDVLFVSYSAYDSFEIPDQQAIETDARTELAAQGYVYVGLRDLETGDAARGGEEHAHRLKSIGQINREFIERLRILEEPAEPVQTREGPTTRGAIFLDAVTKLFRDPSLAGIAPYPLDAPDEIRFARLRTLFGMLSTGHKAVMNMAANLSLHLNRNSLVLLDEPEAHLHPPLVATMLTAVRHLLEIFDASAIAATHSPVVVQETLGQHVLKFRRIEDRTMWDVHPMQTYGENIATLTREAFGLPAAQADYLGVLELLAEQLPSLEQVDHLFGDRGLSSPARAQLLRLLAARLPGGAR